MDAQQSKANEHQVGGQHYRSGIQHWDYVIANNLDYFQSQITKYVTRWKKKGGMLDLQKARHFLDKYIESESMNTVKEVASTASTVKDRRVRLGDRRLANRIPQASPLAAHAWKHPMQGLQEKTNEEAQTTERRFERRD